MAELQLTYLGDFQVTLDEMALGAFQTDKVRALFAYLTMEDQVHQRTELAHFLWPGYSKESAQNSLRQSLHQLRQLLHDAEAKPPWFLLTRQTVQLNPAAPIRIDATGFTQLLAECKAHPHAALARCVACLARLRQAVDLYQGDFLARLPVIDSDPFEEWRRVQQEQLHIQMIEALTQLANAAESNGDEEGALQTAQRQLAMEPWLEATHRQVMRILVQRGQRAAALAQYQRCRLVLAEELGVTPDAETTALYEQIQRSGFDRERARQGERETRRRGEREKGRDGDKEKGGKEATALFVSVSPCFPVSLSPPLPVFPTPLVGRAQALAELDAHLQRPGVRLLTFVGPGGMGKTRLAIEVGRARLAAFADGVFFVPLAPISTADALVGAIAAALGITLQGSDLRRALFQSLRQKQLLLILDNFEHLLVQGTAPNGNQPLGAVDLVVDLMNAAPLVQIIVTSRERLKLRSEQLYPVQALSFATTATLAEAVASAAVRLFVQSVQRVQAEFQLTAANLAAVLRICHLVQGMPLGLELAAASAAGAPLNAIADAIEQSVEFLAVEWRDVPERQRSMRAVFAWSWQLLSDAEQRILCQCAVFRGGFTYTAAQAVTGATLPLLMRLTDKSLLQCQETPTGEGRYALHELLRQFAAEALDATGERALIEERHGRYYLAYLAARGRRLGRQEPKEASSEIQAEVDNIRLAWQWAVAQGRLYEIEQATYAWWQYCQFQGLEFEGRQSFAVAIEGVRWQLARHSADEADVLLGQRLLAKLLALHANYLFAQGCDEEMAAQAREAMALGAANGGFEGETFGTFVLGRALQELGQKRAASEMWQQTIQLVRVYQPSYPENELLHEAHWMAHNWLRGSALHFGNDTESRSYMVQALQICQKLGKRWGELYCLAALAGIDFYRYDFAAAESGFVAALDLARVLRYRRAEMVAQDGLAGLFRLRGDYTTACTLLEQAISMAAELASPYDEALMLAALIRLHCQIGDQTAAARRLEQLTQLLARVKLTKECQLYYCLAAAIQAHAAGATQEALHYAEQADQVNKNGGDIRFRLVDTALILGHVRTAVGQWAGAGAAFQEALNAFTELGKWALAAEPQAGLAQIALAQGDLVSAQAQVEAILPVLAQQPRAGYNDPFFIYLTCYRVLAATADDRAIPLLQQGYDLLQQDLAALDDGRRLCFLSAVPIHRDLVAAYRELASPLLLTEPTPLGS
ncbi:MAG: BTAD domain-containing putative transcriptional regulator [Chloroflexi bacterium]|nr:BTAD domain-containing putative transcriptional regulator [Chloroflexota bacterium]